MRTGEVKSGKGKFVQSSGEFINTGDWTHTGDVDLGRARLTNTKGKMIWREGAWIAPWVGYINHGHWTLDQMTCGDTFRIVNFGDLHLKNSTLSLKDLTNYRNVRIDGGQYLLNTMSNLSNTTLRFQNQDCTFKVDDLQNEGVIEADKGINQRLTLGKGTNTGNIKGLNLIMDVQDSLTSEGEVILKDLVGPGKFINKKQLNFSGIANAPLTTWHQDI